MKMKNSDFKKLKNYSLLKIDFRIKTLQSLLAKAGDDQQKKNWILGGIAQLEFFKNDIGEMKQRELEVMSTK